MSVHDLANKRQVGGAHYRQDGDTPQHWDLSIAYNWDPFQYQVTKYVMRWKDKHSTFEEALKDLQKCEHFIQKYIANARLYWDRHNNLPEHVKVELTNITQDDEDRLFALQEEASKCFQPDGFKTDGTAGYQCVWCRKVVRARSPLGALRQHGSCHPQGYHPLNAPDVSQVPPSPVLATMGVPQGHPVKEE